MCVIVQPTCNACGTNVGEVEHYECIFGGCKYPEECTRLLTRSELRKWKCATHGCGLNMQTIDDRFNEIHRMLRMEADLPLRSAHSDSLGSQDDRAAPEIGSHEGNEASNVGGNLGTVESDGKAVPNPHGFDGDGTSFTDATRRASGLKDTSHDNARPDDSVTADANVANSDNSDLNDKAATSESTATRENAAANENAAAGDNAAANDSLTTNESDETVFDPDSVDLDTFPRCRSCFVSRRRCNGQTPCDKCRQRGCARACRPVTVELLRQYPARAERVLELARRNGGGS